MSEEKRAVDNVWLGEGSRQGMERAGWWIRSGEKRSVDNEFRDRVKGIRELEMKISEQCKS